MYGKELVVADQGVFPTGSDPSPPDIRPLHWTQDSNDDDDDNSNDDDHDNDDKSNDDSDDDCFLPGYEHYTLYDDKNASWGGLKTFLLNLSVNGVLPPLFCG